MTRHLTMTEQADRARPRIPARSGLNDTQEEKRRAGVWMIMLTRPATLAEVRTPVGQLPRGPRSVGGAISGMRS